MFFSFEMILLPERDRWINIIPGSKFDKELAKVMKEIMENLKKIPKKFPDTVKNLLWIYTSCKCVFEDTDAYNRFLEGYKRKLTYFLNKRIRILWCNDFLRKLFNDLLDQKIKKEIKKMDLDLYIRESKDEKMRAFLDALAVDWDKIDSWEIFKKKLVEFCKNAFPNAKKNLDTIYSKTFNENLMKSFFEDIKNKFKDILHNNINENLWEEQIEELENQQSIQNNQENLDLKIYGEIFLMANVLRIFDRNEYFLESYFLKFYAKNICSKFEESSKRMNINKLEKQQDGTNLREELISYVSNEQLSINETIKKISENDEKILGNIINSIAKDNRLDEENKKDLKKYLTRLLSNGRNCRISSLKQKFGIEIIDENMQELFDKLDNMKLENDMIYEEEKNQDDLNVEENEDVAFEADNLETLNNWEQPEDEILSVDLNPVAIFYEQILKYPKYQISDERKPRLEKQIQDLCKNVTFKRILCGEMQKNAFWSPQKKQGRNYYTIEIAQTWYRFILHKFESWVYYFDWLYSHDDYDNRVRNTL